MNTISEIQAGCRALAEKVGPKSYVTLSITSGSTVASLYTKGFVRDPDDMGSFEVFAHNFTDPAAALQELEEKWLAERKARSDRIVEQMALSIIRLTAEFGECTDAALRAEYGQDVAELGAEALERANSMAANGPFSIRTTQSANAA